MFSHCSKSARESELGPHLRTQPLQCTVLLNLHPRTQPLEYTVLLNLHHRTQPLHYAFAQISPYLHLHNPYGTPASSGPLQGLTFSKWHLACHPSTSLSKDPQNPHRCRAHPSVPESQKPSCQSSPGSCQNCLSKSTNSA